MKEEVKEFVMQEVNTLRKHLECIVCNEIYSDIRVRKCCGDFVCKSCESTCKKCNRKSEYFQNKILAKIINALNQHHFIEVKSKVVESIPANIPNKQESSDEKFGPNVVDFYESEETMNSHKTTSLSLNMRKRYMGKETRRKTSHPLISNVNKKRSSELKIQPLKIMKKNHLGETLLHRYAIKGNLEEIEKLLLEGADPNVQDNAGWTPLHEAVINKHVDIVNILIKHGANVNYKGFEERTPLDEALETNNDEIIDILKNHGGETSLKVSENNKTNNLGIVGKTKNCPIVILSGFNEKVKDELVSKVKYLEGKIVEKFSSKVSHLVVLSDEENLCYRTVKYLQCLSSGIPIVNKKWVDESFKHKKWCEPSKYLINGTSNSNGIVKKVFKNGPCKIFKDYKFILLGDFSKSGITTDDINSLVGISGGEIIDKKILKQSDSTTTTNIIIICDDEKTQKNIKRSKFKIFSSKWLVNCISKQDLDI